jgi:hypothetical protein
MAQAMIINARLNQKLIEKPPNINKSKSRTIGVQTGIDEELFFYLTNKKSGRVYFSSVYKQTVLSFNLGTSKSFIIDKASWTILKNNFDEIDKRFNY